MSKNKTRHFYSALAAAFFILIAAGSAKVNKIHCGAFNYSSSGEDRSDKRNYVEMGDGSKVYGGDISWKTGLLVKDQIRIGNEKFPIKETSGYFSGGTYHKRWGSGYITRIIHGKLNVYYDQDVVTSTTTSTDGRMRTTTRTVCRHYVQVGDNGELRAIGNQRDIIEYVKDCPKALEMIDMKDKQIRRSIRKDRDYLNQIFRIYNNDCKGDGSRQF
jgi:hypothetical protein